MTTPTQPPTQTAYTWLRQIPGDLLPLDEKPLLGAPPPFPWKELAQQLGQSLQIPTLSFQPSEWQWRFGSESDLFAGLGEKPRGFSITLSPLAGSLWWAMPEQEIDSLMSLLLAKSPDEMAGNIDSDFFQTFYRFLAIEAVNAYEKVNPDKKLSITISPEEKLPLEACLSLDVNIVLINKTFHGRIYLSSEFRRALAQRYQLQQSQLMLSSPIADSLDLIIHLEAGRVHLTRSEWKAVVPGDFLILETCSVDPDESKGRVMLVINEMPLFRGKIKQGTLKILEHPLEHEVDTVMDHPPDAENNIDEDFESHSDLESDEDFESHENLEDEDFDIDFDEEENHNPAEATQEVPAAATPAPSKRAPKQEKVAPSEIKPPKSIDEVPLPIVVEVGRVQMSIKKVLELQPGNILDLDIHPESNVDLVVHGKRIARGELLRIGDALGVRILELS